MGVTEACETAARRLGKGRRRGQQPGGCVWGGGAVEAAGRLAGGAVEVGGRRSGGSSGEASRSFIFKLIISFISN